MQKFLDAEGLKYLWSKISLADYPNNDTLVAVLNAIDKTKQDKITGQENQFIIIDSEGNPIAQTIDILTSEDKTALEEQIEAKSTKVFRFMDISYMNPRVINYYGQETIQEVVTALRGSPVNGKVNVDLITITANNTAAVARMTSYKAIRKDDGTFDMVIYFGADNVSIYLDAANNKVFVDPDWEAPQANQYLTTDAEGNKVWEEKLAYAVNERKELVTLTTISEGMMLDALFTPSVGDTCLIIYNDQEYHGTCNMADMVSTIQMTEGENFPLTSLKLNCLAGYNLTDSEISALSGTIQIFVTTNTIHPIDNAFIDLPIRKGEQYGAVCLGVENSVKATNLLSAAINQGKAHGQTSLAINSGTTRGENSFAQGLATIASGQSQMVIGAKNIEDTTNTYIQIAGNGSDERSNAYALDWNGNAYFDGDVFVQGDGKTLSFDGAKKLATEEYIDTKVAELVDTAPETLNTLNELAAALGDDPNFATTLAAQIGNKIDKVDGMGLSSNDYTIEDKNKLAGIEAEANKTIIDTTLTIEGAAADAKVVGDLWRAVADDDDVIWLLAQLGLIQKLADEVGVILTDEVGNILLL